METNVSEAETYLGNMVQWQILNVQCLVVKIWMFTVVILGEIVYMMLGCIRKSLIVLVKYLLNVMVKVD